MSVGVTLDGVAADKRRESPIKRGLVSVINATQVFYNKAKKKNSRQTVPSDAQFARKAKLP